MAPARCTDRPCGGPARLIADRSPSTRFVTAVESPCETLDSASTCTAWPSGDTPRSRTTVTVCTAAMSFCRPVSQAWSAAVSGALVRAARTSTGVSLEDPNGAASFAACSLGALAGRKLALLPWVTLASEGRKCGTRPAATSHATTTNHRKRTEKEPIPRKILSICTAQGYGRRPEQGLRFSCPPGFRPPGRAAVGAGGRRRPGPPGPGT